MKLKPFIRSLINIALIAFCLLLFSSPLKAQVQLSEQSKISLLTFGPGTELYKVFGHSALRVQDHSQNLDLAFNYGTFDFNSNNFYWKFVRGDLKYWLSVTSYENMIEEYIENDQTIYEQDFNLTASEKQALFDRLHENFQLANRFYVYDFFLDNCATRIRDIVYQEGAQLKDTVFYQQMTFRDAIDPYLAPVPWIDFVIDILLGYPADFVMTPAQYMFLPEFLAVGFAATSINQTNPVPLIRDTQVLYQGKNTQLQARVFTPSLVFWLLLIPALFFFWRERKYGLNYKVWNDAIVALCLIFGVIMLFLWFGTRHGATKWNYNLLWANPFYILIWLPFFKKKNLRWWISIVFIGFIFTAMISRAIGLLDFHVALFPLWLILITRWLKYAAEDDIIYDQY